MKRFALFLLLSMIAFNANASGLTCADLFKPEQIEAGKFVEKSAAWYREWLAQRGASVDSSVLGSIHAGVSVLRPATADVLVLKKRTSGTSFVQIEVVDGKTGKTTHNVSGHNVEHVAVSPNGEYVYVESEGGITMYGKGTSVYINSTPQFWRSKGMALTADGKALYIFSEVHREMIIIETRYLETGYPLPHFAGDGTRGSHMWPISREATLKPVKRITFKPSEDGRYMVVAGDTGAVTVFDTKTEGRSVFPTAMIRQHSQVLRHDFVVNSSPSRPEIKWTSEFSFEITIDGQTDKFEFKPQTN